MEEPRGPFQTSITINVRNLVVTSPDETKVLKWDPVRGIADTTFSYSLECAQRKVCQVHISIYSTEGVKVYEEWLEQLAPGSYSFTWDGRVNVVPPPPDGLAPAGLYVFDIEVMGPAHYYDYDFVRSRALEIGQHEVYLLVHPPEAQPLYRARTSSSCPALAQYILHGSYPASWVHIEVYDSAFGYITSTDGPTYTIPFDAIPTEDDINEVTFSVSIAEFRGELPYTFVFWAWDGAAAFYKDHEAKTTFANDKEKAVTQAHFIASGPTGITGGLDWFISNVGPYLWGYWVPIRDLFGRPVVDQYGRQLWRRYPLARSYVHWHGSGSPNFYSAFQEWDPERILDAISHVQVLTLGAHGNLDKMGRLFGRGLLTAQDILDRYSGTWYWWDYFSGKPIQRQGLSHLRVVLLMACKTGGDKHPYAGDPDKMEKEMVAEPQAGTIAGAFWSLCAKVVIFSTYPKTWGDAMTDFARLFYYYAQTNPIPEAARLARQTLIEKHKDESLGKRHYRETLYNILMAVKPDAWNLTLAP